MRTDSSISKGVAFGAIAGALWGFLFIVPAQLSAFSPLQIAVGRFLMYGIASGIALIPRWPRLASVLRPADWLEIIVLSLVGNCIYFLFMTTGVQQAGSAPTSLIVGLIPVTTTLAALRHDRTISLRRLIPALVLCTVGVALVAYDTLSKDAASFALTQSRALGIACASAALLSWTLFSVRNSRWLERRSSIAPIDGALLVGVMTGLISLLAAYPAFGRGAVEAHSTPAWIEFWLVCAGAGLLGSIVAHGFWNRAARLLPLTLMGPMIVFETVFALLYTFVWELRGPSLVEGIAIVSLLAGVIASTRAHRGGEVLLHDDTSQATEL